MTAKLPHVPPGDPASMLSADRRRRDIDRLSGRKVDVLVIGGGITGAGVALDAATRGLSVALVESEDLAYGTSRWSSKLVHGGLRYLAKLQVGVAWESAVERERIMAAIAPHLVRPMPQVLPDLEGVPQNLARAGLRAADSLRRATGSTLQPPSRMNQAQLQAYAPGVRGDVGGGWLSWDGQLVDDARLVVAVARTAAAYGARILTHTEVLGDGAAPGPGTVELADSLTSERWQLTASHVINATGAWAAGLDPRVQLVRSRGTHLVVPTEAIGGGDAAIMAPVAGSTSRFVFALPQPEGLTFIGLTDVPTDDPLDHPTASDDEVDFLLTTFNQALDVPLAEADVITTYSGYRPLLSGGTAGGASADLSRRHAVLPEDPASGLPLSIVGGKLTTYRRMAEDAIDLVTDRPCRTRRLPLVGAQPWRAGASRLTQRFGAEADRVAALAPGRGAALGPIADTPVLAVELAWALLAEGAVTDADVLERRLRLDLAPQWRDAVVAELAAGSPARAA